ncbi:phosphomethylpyrimidine synthase ThiC [Desulfurivibrio alkaliphilus]|uniref:Phosphomethylpyrimidine synthase n=1 Tax=Desulfurivibrio alkaliphilus (strain DSM 19089 / UNIQEM U267 / AHT2) TaxID=589865 RepID=D6Z416_DESAT|nr:phosphomethylpyrimidine synthase ThiC [Desulfurivibrio alkaliphilus]ADH86291.1 thiamine biosynthesis protein ThiC [Desulfurivibrio alkaliphilus AHT 2]
MATQIQRARAGEISDEMAQVAAAEGVEAEMVRGGVAAGTIVIPCNHGRQQRAVGIGRGLGTKVNASIGTSSDIIDYTAEEVKAKAAEEEGADTLMELSVGGNLDEVRRRVLAATTLPVGNVPLYQAFCEASRRYGDPNKLDEELLFDLIEQQCADGISFMAIHCGINLYTIERLRKQGYRYGGLVSKGGTQMIAWMLANNRDNPLYTKFDRVVEILRRHDVVLSLGNGIRAGAIHDSSDRAQVAELVINCELAELGREMGCQMMVEGPGHVPLDEIEGNIQLQKRMSGDAPYYVLGPLPCDVGAGYDHVTAAVGAASSSRYGADLICYITPAEHLALPNEDDVREGVRVARLAVHMGDIVKLGERAKKRDRAMSRARRDMQWEQQFELGLFGRQAKEVRDSRSPGDQQTCTMCGEFCAAKNAEAIFSDCTSQAKQ